MVHEKYGLNIDVNSEIALGVGVAFGVNAAVWLVEVLIIDPDYQMYRPQAASTGARVISVPLK